MRDLRRQALESGKTVSRKAQSRISSRTSSAANSPVQSRSQSRHGSDEDEAEGSLSDSTNWSANSIDDLVAWEASEDVNETWKQDLADRVEEIIDRKRSSIQGREATLASYNHILMSQYAFEEIDPKRSELFPALLKSVKTESSEKETSLALRAIALTIITTPSESAYDGIFRTIKTAYIDSEHIPVKVAAIHTLGAAAIYGGAADSEVQDIMDGFLELIESDGESVGAGDSGEVVAAACEEWGFLATSLDDVEDIAEIAADAFVEQLESSDTSVLVAAGENIALLYEKSYRERRVDDPFPEAREPHFEGEDERSDIDLTMVKSYDVYGQKHQLEHTLSQLANESTKRITKRDRKELHMNFTDILHTVENPHHGPRYGTALKKKSQQSYGSRMAIQLNKSGSMKIDKWWKLHRLQALRRILGGGFAMHYEKNEVVFDSLPL